MTAVSPCQRDATPRRAEGRPEGGLSEKLLIRPNTGHSAASTCVIALGRERSLDGNERRQRHLERLIRVVNRDK